MKPASDGLIPRRCSIRVPQGLSLRTSQSHIETLASEPDKNATGEAFMYYVALGRRLLEIDPTSRN
jgi:hypothetical protein